MLEVSWPHLNLVYEVLLRLLIHIPPRSMRELMSERFIAQLFELLRSPDPRERDYVKTILHRIYF
jgi:serine/threonine-protein phosphatase 2A regulatory subunit B'